MMMIIKHVILLKERYTSDQIVSPFSWLSFHLLKLKPYTHTQAKPEVDAIEVVNPYLEVSEFSPALIPALGKSFETQISISDEPPDYDKANRALQVGATMSSGPVMKCGALQWLTSIL